MRQPSPHDPAASAPGEHTVVRWSRQELLCALATHQFRPYFQPKVSLATGTADSVEILARWAHPTSGLLPSAQFIARINEEAFSADLSFSMFAIALASARRWLDRSCPMSLALNLPARALLEKDIAERTLEKIDMAGIHPQAVMLELGDLVAVETSAQVRTAVSGLQEAGFRLSINVSGAAPAALLARHAWRFCELKMDVALIKRLSQAATTRPAIESLFELARKLGMNTVAQGIETSSDLALARAFNCSTGQGWFLGPPMTEEQLVLWHARSHTSS